MTLPSPTSRRKSTTNMLRTWWPPLMLIVGVFFLRTVMVSERSTASVPQSIQSHEQINQEQIQTIQKLIDTNEDPDILALQLLKTNNVHEFTQIATAIAQREGPPFSDMDFSKLDPFCKGQKRCNCGVHKCFHPSHDSNLGYLVAGGSNRHSKMMAAYEREEYLINEYGITRMSVDAPYVAQNVSKPMIQVLKLYGKSHSLPIVIGQVYKAPEPNLFVGAGNHKSQRTKNHIPQFAADLASGGKKAVQEFKERFKEEVKRCSKVVSDPNNLYLRHDWQAIIDSSGTIYFIDLDRGLEDLDNYPKLRPKRINQGMEMIGKFLTTGLENNFTGLQEADIFVYDDDRR